MDKAIRGAVVVVNEVPAHVDRAAGEVVVGERDAAEGVDAAITFHEAYAAQSDDRLVPSEAMELKSTFVRTGTIWSRTCVLF